MVSLIDYNVAMREEDLIVLGEIAKQVYDGKLEDGKYGRHSKMKFGVTVDVDYEVQNGDLFINSIK